MIFSAEDVVNFVVTSDPWVPDLNADDRPMCFYCGKSRAIVDAGGGLQYPRAGEPDATKHYPLCVWANARKLIQGEPA